MFDPAAVSPNLTERGRVPSFLRFSVELIAWIATPWALADFSVVLAILSVVVLVGLPTLFSTPGDKKQTLIAVPGTVTIALVVLHFAAAVISAWLAWHAWLAILVTALVLVTALAELPRWRWLLHARGGDDRGRLRRESQPVAGSEETRRRR
ncbi:hypothetical protein [Nocardia blacklockiae]|uniref:hypothetical protein n=1 Tax=Nocardia blacklockiae TaxID=480036 RepID=UPI001E5D8F95|nr:hypothetical protein [Nocardia blacklockiae]